ncbi:adenosylhomocysteinase, partial [Candidatus Gottesmanbacteria bacterium]|nr:adenosylhomocysteinase [Candidatus Gottesmanbacteria bacterium]
MNKNNFDIKDLTLAPKGKLRIEWTGEHMAVLGLIRQRFAEEKPLTGIKIGACLHVTAETANLVLTLKAGGANVSLCASNPLSTQDDVAASLVKDFEIPVFAKKGEDNKTYYQHIKAVLSTRPNITMDDGADLISQLHKAHKPTHYNNIYYYSEKGKLKGWEFYGSSEETTTGVIRLRAMEKDRALALPVIAVNDSQTKRFFDNRYGTGQSTVDGILRATNLLLAGKNFVVCGYGWCGRGIATRARGMGAKVIITEVDPIKALEAVMDGYQVLAVRQAAKIGDIFVTATGDKDVITLDHIHQMKDGAILANAGHFNVEVAVEELEKVAISKRQVKPYVEEYELKNTSDGGRLKRRGSHDSSEVKGRKKIYVLGEGRLINLVAAEGHPPEVMDMSFANQALAAEWILKNRGKLSLLDELVVNSTSVVQRGIANSYQSGKGLWSGYIYL